MDDVSRTEEPVSHIEVPVFLPACTAIFNYSRMALWWQLTLYPSKRWSSPFVSIITFTTFLSYHCLSLPYYAFVFTLSFIYVPQSTCETHLHFRSQHVIVNEMTVVHMNGTWTWYLYLPAKSQWSVVVYIVKVGYDGHVNHLKALMVTKCYAYISGLDYDYIFPIPNMATVWMFSPCLLCSLHGCYVTLSYLPDSIKNAFLHGDLAKKDYIRNYLILLLKGNPVKCAVVPYSIRLKTISLSTVRTF